MRAILAFVLLAVQEDPIEPILATIRPSAEERRWRLIPFHDSLKRAFEIAKKERKPVFYFGADGVLDTGNC